MCEKMKFMTDSEAKEAIIDIGKRMYNRGFVAANDGNISCKVGENLIWATPTGLSKGFMTENMLVKLDLDGNIIEGTYKVSTEIKMHLKVYKENPEVSAVTHAHPPFSTSLAAAGIPLDKPILADNVLILGPVPVTPYATPGTSEVPDSIAPYCRTNNAVLLANHGALTWGRDIYESFYRLESLEHCAKIYIISEHLIGRSNVLSDEQVDTLIRIREKRQQPVDTRH